MMFFSVLIIYFPIQITTETYCRATTYDDHDHDDHHDSDLNPEVGGDKQQRLNIPTLGFPGDDSQCVRLPGTSGEHSPTFL